METGTEVEAAVGRRVMDTIRRVNAKRQAATTARREVITAIWRTWPPPRRPTARQVRDCWIALAPDLPPPSVRFIQEQLQGLRAA